MASAKALRWEQSWSVLRRARRPLWVEWSEQKGRVIEERMRSESTRDQIMWSLVSHWLFSK